MTRPFLAALAACVAFTGAVLAQTGTAPLPALKADLTQTTVSGISSGGFMAAQLATAFSGRITGVGVVAAGPYYCAGTYGAIGTLENAMSTCMTPFNPDTGPNGIISLRNAKAFAAAGKIDPVKNLARQRVYLFSGAKDNTVKTMVVEQVRAYYVLAGAGRDQVKYVYNGQAGHAFVTSDPGDQACPITGSPYINNCGFMQAHDLLRQLYPERIAPVATTLAGQLIRFNQRAFIQGGRSSMDDEAWVYVPAKCWDGGCAVHVAFHGCLQGATEIGTRFYQHAGYNELAETNRLIVLYPQAHISKGIPFNPQGCWDFWGYSNGENSADTFATRSAPQMAAVMAMLDRLGQKP